MIQMEVMGTPGIFGRLHLTSRVFHSACNSTGDVYCKYREKGINLQRDPYFVTKTHTLNFDPFALFMSVQRIVGKNSLRFCIVHTVLGQIYSFPCSPGFGMLAAFKVNSFR